MSILGDIFGFSDPRNFQLNAFSEHNAAVQAAMMRSQVPVPNYGAAAVDRAVLIAREKADAKKIAQPMVDDLMREHLRQAFPEFPVIPNQRATLSPEPHQ